MCPTRLQVKPHVCQRESREDSEAECSCTVEPKCAASGWQSDVEISGVLAVRSDFSDIPMQWLDDVVGYAAFELGFEACQDAAFSNQNGALCSNERQDAKKMFLAGSDYFQDAYVGTIQVNRTVSPAFMMSPLLLQDWLTGDSSTVDLYALPKARVGGLDATFFLTLS